MKLIIITSPQFFAGEAALISDMLDMGADIVHLRKPGSSINQCAALLDAIPARLHNRIVVHYHHSLCRDFGLGGIHFSPLANHNADELIANKMIIRSCSCHSLAEVANRKSDYDYMFLSPVFNSISKQGYSSAFTLEQLREAAEKGVIDEKTIALGGITLEHIPLLRSLSFGGVALLGDIWNRICADDFSDYLLRLIEKSKSL